MVSSCAYSTHCDTSDFSCNPWAALGLFQAQKYGQVSNGFDGDTVLLFPDGTVRAWGGASNGRLGNNGTVNVGDGAGPSIISTGDILVGATVSQISAGHQSTCALLSDANVKCWGFGGEGRTGYNSEDNIGDGIGLAVKDKGIVPIGVTVTQVEAGPHFTCALLTTGNVRCWGNSPAGETGYNSTNRIGDGMGLSIIDAGDVPLGAPAKFIDVGGDGACAVLTNGAVRCWGNGANGRLGHNSSTNIGDTPANSIINAGDVPIGELAVSVSVGLEHTCAVLVTGAVRCWGNGANGRLGHNSTSNIGNGVQSIIAAGDIPLGGLARQVAAGSDSTCALLTSGSVRCWGNGTDGALGYNSTSNVGDGVGPNILTVGDVQVGGPVRQISSAGGVACALMESVPTRLRCWGAGANGALGFNVTSSIGNGSWLSIITAGDVPVGKN